MSGGDELVVETATADGARAPDPLPPRRKPRFKQQFKDALVALSLANLCFISAWFPALYHSDFTYFNKQALTRPTLLAFLANLSWLTLAVWLAIRARRRYQARWLHLVCDLAFTALLLVPLDFCRTMYLHVTLYKLSAMLTHTPIRLGAVVLLGFTLWQHRRIARAEAILVGLLSPLALLTVAKVVLLVVGLERLKQSDFQPVLPPPGPVAAGQPRVLWVLYDETDQRLAFDQRPPGVQLPEFDRLRQESITATNAFPPGNRTLLSVPALTSGIRLASAAPKDASDLTVTLAETKESRDWTRLPSVFATARQLGINTAVVGWYHPYDRVFARDLNFCRWYAYPTFEPARAPEFWVAFRRELACLSRNHHFRQLYSDLCRASLAESTVLVTNQTYGLVFLHLPPPHPPGIYQPQSGQFTASRSRVPDGYFRNLALADRSLGEFRRALEHSGLWSQTWLIVSSDHSWRGSREYDGQHDLRVPFLVKVPGSARPVSYGAQFNTVLTHDLVLAILRHELSVQTDVIRWLDAHRSTQPTIEDQAEVE